MPTAPQAVSRVAQSSERRKLQARSLSPFNWTTARSSAVFASIRRIADGRLKKGTVEARAAGKKEKNIAAFGHNDASARSVSAKERIHRQAESDATSDHKTTEERPAGESSAAATVPANIPSNASRGLRPTRRLGHRRTITHSTPAPAAASAIPMTRCSRLNPPLIIEGIQ